MDSPPNTPKPRLRTDRLMLILGLLALAMVLGIVGGMNNWYAFAFGEVSTSRPATASTDAPTPEDASPAPSVTPSPTTPTGEAGAHSQEYRKGRAEGVVDGFQAGRVQGRKDGLARGEERGRALGGKEGYDAGYARGYAAGYDAGYARGHACVQPKPFCNSLGSR